MSSSFRAGEQHQAQVQSWIRQSSQRWMNYEKNLAAWFIYDNDELIKINVLRQNANDDFSQRESNLD
nr:hypothetical protein [uncultured Undibacterium sp.]